MKSIMDFIRERKAVAAAKEQARKDRMAAMAARSEQTIAEAKTKIKNAADEASSLVLDQRYPHFVEFVEAIIRLSGEGLANSLRKAATVNDLIEAARYQAVIDFARDLKFYPEKIMKQAERARGTK